MPAMTQTVYLLNGGAGVSVTAQPIYFYSGRTGAPSADALQPAPGQPGQYKGIVDRKSVV